MFAVQKIKNSQALNNNIILCQIIKIPYVKMVHHQSEVLFLQKALWFPQVKDDDSAFSLLSSCSWLSIKVGMLDVYYPSDSAQKNWKWERNSKQHPFVVSSFTFNL